MHFEVASFTLRVYLTYGLFVSLSLINVDFVSGFNEQTEYGIYINVFYDYIQHG